MPAVIAQTTEVIDQNHATVTIVTPAFGTIFVDVVRTTGPTRITITSFRDGVQQGQTVLSNPPASQVEAQIDAAISALIDSFQFRSHLVSNNPIVIAIATFDNGVTIPPNWWA